MGGRHITALVSVIIISIFIFSSSIASYAAETNEPKETKDKQENQPTSTSSAKQSQTKAPKKAGGLVTNVFYDTPIRDALMDIASQTGVTIVPDLSVKGIVTCELTDATLEKALDIVLSVGNYVYRNMGDYILVGSLDLESPSFLKLSETQTVSLNYIKPADAVKMLYEPFRKLVTAHDASHLVSITAPPAIMKQIKSTLGDIDRPPKQIVLEVRVAVMESGDLLDLGVKWQWPQIVGGAFTNNAQSNPKWPWGIQVGYTPGQEFTNALMLSLSLLEQNNKATMLSNSQVMAQNGKDAEIKVTTEEYFEIITSAGLYATADLKNIEVGTILHIVPEIGDNKNITLNMQAEVSDVVARGQNNLPVVTRRRASSTVRVLDGGTAVVGGLLDNRMFFSKDQVPGLGYIPLLGYLFRSDSTRNSLRQVAIFITPRIISESPADAVKSSSMPSAIKPAGDEFRNSLEQEIKIHFRGGEQK